VSSLRALLEGVVDVGVWFDAKAEYQSRKQRIKRGSKPRPRKDFETEYEIALSPLPCWEHLSTEERQERAKTIVEEIERMAQERRTKTKRRPLGVARILAQHPHAHPEKVAKSAAPMVHASSRAERRNFADRYYRFVRRFRSACADTSEATCARWTASLAAASFRGRRSASGGPHRTKRLRNRRRRSFPQSRGDSQTWPIRSPREPTRTIRCVSAVVSPLETDLSARTRA
jgi:hypothetical protein